MSARNRRKRQRFGERQQRRTTAAKAAAPVPEITPTDVDVFCSYACTTDVTDVANAKRLSRDELMRRLGDRRRGAVTHYIVEPSQVGAFLDDAEALPDDPTEGTDDYDDLRAWFTGHPFGLLVVATAHGVRKTPDPDVGPAVDVAPTVRFATHCRHVIGAGYSCMIGAGKCPPSTGHVTVTGGPHDGRCLAYACEYHASPAGYDDVKARLAEWMLADLLTPDLGPGGDGAPEVWHIDHLDPLPDHRHA